MPAQRIAITIPPPSLEKLDAWVNKQGISRSRFVVQAIEQHIEKLEEDEITRRYNEVCEDPKTAAYDRDLAEEMLGVAEEPEETW